MTFFPYCEEFIVIIYAQQVVIFNSKFKEQISQREKNSVVNHTDHNNSHDKFEELVTTNTVSALIRLFLILISVWKKINSAK